jgi:hypothetical protein
VDTVHDRQPPIEAPAGFTLLLGDASPPGGHTPEDRIAVFKARGGRFYGDVRNVNVHQRRPLRALGKPGCVDQRPARDLPPPSLGIGMTMLEETIIDSGTGNAQPVSSRAPRSSTGY